MEVIAYPRQQARPQHTSADVRYPGTPAYMTTLHQAYSSSEHFIFFLISDFAFKKYWIFSVLSEQHSCWHRLS